MAEQVNIPSGAATFFAAPIKKEIEALAKKIDTFGKSTS